jgi:FkbM family methyltransferase
MLADDLIYDIGLHRGEDTAYYLRKGYRVLGFEANPRLVYQARQRFADEISRGQLEIVEGAIADSDADTVAFYQNPRTTAWGTINSAWVERNRSGAERIDVPVVRFRDHLIRTGTPYYIKIDIEGADAFCLNALLAVDDPPVYVSIESEKLHFPALQHELDVLERIGFDRFAAVQQWGMSQRVIETCDRAGRPFRYRFEAEASGGFGADIATWSTRDQVERRYRSIFRRYRLFGDQALINRTGVGFRLRHETSRLLGVPLPGWYDTHARRS